MSRPIRRLIMCLLGVLAAIALPVGAAAAASPPALTEAQAQQVGTDAYVYGILVDGVPPPAEAEHQRHRPEQARRCAGQSARQRRDARDSEQRGVRRAEPRHALHLRSPEPDQGPARAARPEDLGGALLRLRVPRPLHQRLPLRRHAHDRQRRRQLRDRRPEIPRQAARRAAPHPLHLREHLARRPHPGLPPPPTSRPCTRSRPSTS